VHVAAHLIGRAPLTVAVLSLQAAARLADQPGIELLVAGGRSRPGERSLVGPLALRTLESLAFDCFIMSIGGVHAEHGWSEFSLDDAAVKQAAPAPATRSSTRSSTPSRKGCSSAATRSCASAAPPKAPTGWSRRPAPRASTSTPAPPTSPPPRDHGRRHSRPPGGGVAAEGEDITVVELPFSQALAMTRTGEIADAKTILLLQWAALDGPFHPDARQRDPVHRLPAGSRRSSA
jgi:hypothetical protein